MNSGVILDADELHHLGQFRVEPDGWRRRNRVLRRPNRLVLGTPLYRAVRLHDFREHRRGQHRGRSRDGGRDRGRDPAPGGPAGSVSVELTGCTISQNETCTARSRNRFRRRELRSSTHRMYHFPNQAGAPKRRFISTARKQLSPSARYLIIPSHAASTNEVAAFGLRRRQIFNGGGSQGTLDLIQCSLTGNSAIISCNGGAIANQAKGVYTGSNSYPQLYDPTTNLVGCTISGNSATNGNGSGLYDGIGTDPQKDYGQRGYLNLANCTIYGNDATNALGGGVYSDSVTSLANCTITGNRASTAVSSGGLCVGDTLGEGDVTLNNTLIAGNFAARPKQHAGRRQRCG